MPATPTRPAVPALLLGLALLASLAACTSPRERRLRIDEIDVAWRERVEDDSHEQLLEDVRALGRLSPEHPQAWAALPVLCRQALQSPSALARAECLKAGWRLAGPFPEEPFRPDELPPGEFSDRTRRFEELLEEPDGRESPEILELARFMGSYRFTPARPVLAINLADVVASRALWDDPGPLQQTFAELAPGSLRHALTLVTLQASGDPFPVVREEALRAARHLHPDLAVQMLVRALEQEEDTSLLFAGLGSLQALAPRLEAAEVEGLLAWFESQQDVALRRRVALVRAALS